ncbi:hypothetical protein GCM10022221_67950 [Actinocorallia aurea]
MHEQPVFPRPVLDAFGVPVLPRLIPHPPAWASLFVARQRRPAPAGMVGLLAAMRAAEGVVPRFRLRVECEDGLRPVLREQVVTVHGQGWARWERSFPLRVAPWVWVGGWWGGQWPPLPAAWPVECGFPPPQCAHL